MRALIAVIGTEGQSPSKFCILNLRFGLHISDLVTFKLEKLPLSENLFPALIFLKSHIFACHHSHN